MAKLVKKNKHPPPVYLGDAPPPLHDEQRQNFRTLRNARANDLVLISAVDKQGQQCAVVCAKNTTESGRIELVPLAKLIDNLDEVTANWESYASYLLPPKQKK